MGTAYRKLVACDRDVAEGNYFRIMEKATDTDTLVSLSMAAIDSEVWSPVWQELSKISSYDARDEIATRIGQECSDDKVLKFLQGSYFALKGLDFQQWDDAFIVCESDELSTWIGAQIESPPAQVYDEKYNSILDIAGEKLGSQALPHLSKAAIIAAASGPYDSILMQMDTSVAPSLGESMSQEMQQLLEDALVNVASNVDPEKARSVADRLANSGSLAAAATLLPTVYGDRMKNGSFSYGAVSIELGSCDGVKTAVVHTAEIVEPGKRWYIMDDIESPMRAFKPRLKKCDAETDVWSVATTPEPVRSSKDRSNWVDSDATQWESKGYEVKTQSEKAIKLD